MATKIRRALFIGLGGTGMTTLLHTKKILYDNYGEIPPMLGFLGIDTDGSSYNRWLEARDGKHITLDTAEQLRINVRNPIDIYRVGKGQGKYGWIAPGNENALTVLDRGAGQIRSNGRFAITERQQDVEARLQAKKDQITRATLTDNTKYQLLDTEIDIHIIFSLAGGTGGGTFINLAYLVQDLFRGCKISGYAVMGEVFRTMLNGSAVARVRSNTYGAMMDLDYLMHLTPLSEGVPFEQFDKTQSVQYRPFNALYLIDNKNRNNDTYTDVDQISEMISLALVTSVGQISDAAAAVADNVEKIIAEGSMDVANKRAWVSSLGVSEIIYNAEALAKIYANKARINLINQFTNAVGGDPSRIANGWIDTEKIRENLGKDDIIDYFMSPVPAIPLDELDQPDQPTLECDHYINNLAQELTQALDSEYTALTQRIDKSLEKLLQEHINREGGFYDCQSILTTLNEQFSLCDGEMQSEIDDFSQALPLKQSQLESSCRELEDLMSRWFLKTGKKTKIAAVCEAAVDVATCKREITRRQYARQFYGWVRTKIDAYQSELNALGTTLRAVTDRSVASIEGIRAGIGKDSFFQYNLAATVVDSVDCPSGDVVFNDFVEKERPGGGLWTWTHLTSQQVAERIWAFTSSLPEARRYCSQTVDDVLHSLDEAELDRVCTLAIGKAQPLLRTDLRGYHASSQPDNSYYVGVHSREDSALDKDDFFKRLVPEAGANVNIVPIGLKDRIIVFHQFGVVPAFAVSALDACLSEYTEREQARPGSSYWDYGLYQRMKGEHFRLMPQDVASEGEVVEYWVQALLFGLVAKRESGEWAVKSTVLGRPIEQYWVGLGAQRIEAFCRFKDYLPEISADLDEQVHRLTSDDRTLPGRLKKEAQQEVSDGVYHLPGHLSLNDIPLDQLQSLYPEDYELLNKEITFIQNM